MCGRYNIETNAQALRDAFEIVNDVPAEGFHAYNVSPDQGSERRPAALRPVVRLGSRGNELAMMQWWLLPHWSKERVAKYSTFNAKAETLAKSAAFRDAFKHKRCLVPASGFYEWQRRDGTRLPWNIKVKGGLFALAGIWDRWQREGEIVESYAIVVTEANGMMRLIHDRMPVILHRADYATWLDPRNDDTGALRELLVPYPAEQMETYRVSPRVNNPRSEGSDLLLPV